MASSRRYEDSEILMEMYGGIIYVYLKNDVVVNQEVAERLLNERLKISNGFSYPILLDASNARYWTMQSRNSNMKGRAFDLILCCAIVFRSKVIKIIWDYTLRFFPVPIDYKIFNNVQDAEEWLRKKIKVEM